VPFQSSRYSVARFTLDAPILPLVQSTLPVAEAVHRCLVWLHCNQTPAVGEAGHSRVLVGKDEAGRRLEGHGHAYYLPTDEDGDGRIDHVTVTAAAGFGAGEVRALDRFRRLRWGDAEPLRLLLTGLGAAGDFRARLFGPAAVWVSATPFIVTRYPKPRGRKRDDPATYATPLAFARHVLGQELERLGQRRPDLPDITAIEPLADQCFGAGRLRSLQFKKFRRKPGDDGGRRPSGAFRITFAAPVRGASLLLILGRAHRELARRDQHQFHADAVLDLLRLFLLLGCLRRLGPDGVGGQSGDDEAGRNQDAMRQHGYGPWNSEIHGCLPDSLREQAAERHSSAAGPAGETAYRGKPQCRPGRLQRLVRQ